MNFKLGQVETGKVSGAWQPRVARLLALEWLRLGAVASPCLWDWPECGQSLCPNPPTPVWNVLSPSLQGSSSYKKPSACSPGFFPSSGLSSHRRTEPYASLTAHVSPTVAFGKLHWPVTENATRACLNHNGDGLVHVKREV